MATTTSNTSKTVNTNYNYRVKTAAGKTKVPYRKEASSSSERLGYLETGKIYYSDKQTYLKAADIYWYHIVDKGWVSGGSLNITLQEKSGVRYDITTSDKNKISVYSDLSKNSSVVKVLVKSADITGSIKKKDADGVYWYKIDTYNGWVCEKDLKSIDTKDKWATVKTDKQKKQEAEAKAKAEERLKAINNTSDAKIKNAKNLSKWLSSGTKQEQEAKQSRLEDYVDDQAALNYFNPDTKEGQANTVNLSDAVNSLFNSNMIGFFGAPYQFDENTDEKLEGTQFGVTYAQKILTRMPLLLVTPGKASYMSDFKKSDKYTALQKLLGITPSDENDANQVTMSDIIGGSATGEIVDSGRYFTFEFDSETYFDYVNGMCRAGAKFLGIENSYISVSNKAGSKSSSTKLADFNWKNAVNSKIKKNIRAQETISFYVDSYTSSDEDFSNTTTESQIAAKVNSFADIGRELQFLMGTTTGDVPKWMQPNNLESTLADMQSMSEEYLNGHQLLTDLAKNFATVATGGQLLFPEIWADHDYSKSYSVSLKLRTPDNDLLSWYLNIYVPLCHLVCLTAPRQVSGNVANGYMSPFLIRAYLKGAFNCDCGIVTSLSISRGKEGSWTINGLPTEVDVNVSFKDLYSMIILSKASKADWFMSNTALMDYIACNCGVNINEPDLKRQITMYLSLKKNEYLQLPNRTWGLFTQELSNKIANMYSRIGL